MNRRNFFGLLAAAPTAIVAPELAELLAPKRTFFLSPKGGWLLTGKYDVRIEIGPEHFSRYSVDETVRIIQQRFCLGDQWDKIPHSTPRPVFEFNRIKLGDCISIAGALRS